MSSLLSNISSLDAGGDSSLLDPADALRNAAAISSVAEYAPEPESAAELAEVIELKVCEKRQQALRYPANVVRSMFDAVSPPKCCINN